MSGIWKRNHRVTAPDLDSTLSRGFPRGLPEQRHPQKSGFDYFTPPGKKRRSFCPTMPMPAHAVIDSNDEFMGDDVAGEGGGASPGSGGASPYLRRGMPARLFCFTTPMVRIVIDSID